MAKQSNTPKVSKEKIKIDLDSLFKNKKRAKPIAKKTVEVAKVAPVKGKKAEIKAKPVVKKIVSKTAEAQKVRRVTDDGFKIYTEEELGIGKGGDTDLCPFDCDCCF